MTAILGELMTAMATPFAADGSLSIDAARRLARHLVENGSDGIVVAGTTGEGPTIGDHEKLDLFEAVVAEVGATSTVIANTGTYEVADSTLTIHPVVARDPNYMAGGSDKYTFRVSGDTLWLSNTGSDIRTMIGGQLVGPSRTPNATALVLVRQK